MSSSKVVSEDAKREFWAVVQACLSEFHGIKRETLRRKADKLRNGIERMTVAESEYFYHSEPFDIACELADNPVNVKDYLDRYLHLRDEKHVNGVTKPTAQGRRSVKVRK
jgi:hypothetical protein